MPNESKQASQQPASVAGHRFFSNLKEAIAILGRALDENRSLLALESADLSSLMNWDYEEANKQLKRLAKRRHWLAVAGSPDDRAKALQAIENAKRILVARGGEIESQIARLQAELNKLQGDVVRSERRHQEMVEAVAMSKTTLPAELATLHSRQKGDIKDRHWPSISQVQAELNECLGVVARHTNRDLHLMPDKYVGFNPILKKSFVKPEWFEYRKVCEAKIPSLQERLAELESALAAELAAFDASVECVK
jgi:hypothetical protein